MLQLCITVCASHSMAHHFATKTEIKPSPVVVLGVQIQNVVFAVYRRWKLDSQSARDRMFRRIKYHRLLSLFSVSSNAFKHHPCHGAALALCSVFQGLNALQWKELSCSCFSAVKQFGFCANPLMDPRSAYAAQTGEFRYNCSAGTNIFVITVMWKTKEQ